VTNDAKQSGVNSGNEGNKMAKNDGDQAEERIMVGSNGRRTTSEDKANISRYGRVANNIKWHDEW